MSTIKIGNRDFWEEAYQICSGHIAAIEKNKVRSIIKEPTPFEELKDYPIDLSSINSSFEKKATSDVKTSTKQFQTNEMNSPLIPTFYETPPSVLANSTKNKNVKVHEEKVLGVDDNDLDLSGIPERLRQLEANKGGLPVQNLQGIAATQGVPLEDVLRLPSKLPSFFSNIKNNLIGAMLGASLLLTPGVKTGVDDIIKPTEAKTSMIKMLLDEKHYRYNQKNISTLLTTLKNTLDSEKNMPLDTKLKIATNFHLLNKEDSLARTTGLHLNVTGDTAPRFSRKGYNVLEAHAGIDAKGKNYIILGKETAASKKLGYKLGQRLDSFETSELLLETEGFDKKLPLIISACNVGKVGDSGINFLEDVATFTGSRTIGGDAYVVYEKELGDYGVFRKSFNANTKKMESDINLPGNVISFDPDY